MTVFCPCTKKNKRVTFDIIVDIIIVPSCYYSNVHKIWWSNTEIVLFKESFLLDITCLKNKHPKMTTQDAITLLYQPPKSTIMYKKTNFC